MKLSKYLDLMKEGEELTVWDADYDMEAYFYGGKPKDEWDNWNKSMHELANLLTITQIKTNGVTVNLSRLIEKKIDKLKEADLFYDCDIDSIMEGMNETLAGFVGEKWLNKLIEILKSK